VLWCEERIAAVLDDLTARAAPGAWEKAARAIMTTDTFPKGAGRTLDLDGARVAVAGFAKGSGMIAPDMATMLAFVFTDAAIARPLLQATLADANTRAFNAITVDGDTSTSDTLLLAATGESGAAPIASADDPRYPAVRAAIEDVLRDLAHQVVKDGEGASKFIAITVTGAESDAAARRIGLSIANSPLIKTACAGEDPNWGRIVMAVGKAGETADRDRLSIRFGDILVADRGWVADGYREEDGAAYMKRAELAVTVDVGVGAGAATVWTCDLTHAYVSINADYRS
jgi:glutamate N-acetyltransferase/amino-acid N-acetyltransferase